MCVCYTSMSFNRQVLMGVLSNGQPGTSRRAADTSSRFVHTPRGASCAFVCVSDIPGHRPLSLTWFNNVTVSAHSTFTFTNIQVCWCCVPRVIEYSSYFSFPLTGRVTLRDTNTQIYNTQCTYTHIYAAISSGQRNSICLVQQAVG